jgi:uncharacterized membrane protein YcaP (DUF421 family)
MINLINIVTRTIIMFFLTLIIIRITGKSSITRATPFKFVSYIVISIIAAAITLGLIKTIAFGYVSLAIWVLLLFIIDYLSIKSKLIHDLINGKQIVVIKNGKIMEDKLIGARLTGDELIRELRWKNIFKLADVEFAVMETTGDISVLLKSDKKPVTASDIGRKVAPEAETHTVIMDGNILDEQLTGLGLNRNWLKIKLSESGVKLSNVYLGQVDSSGDLYIDLFDDMIKVPEPKAKEMLYANIEKIHADFLSFALETENQKAKHMYTTNATKLKKILDKLEPYLLR